MFQHREKFLVCVCVFFTILDLVSSATLKDTILPKKSSTERRRRAIDGNDLPPLPVTRQTTSHGLPVEFRNSGVSQQQQPNRQANTYVANSNQYSRPRVNDDSSNNDTVQVGSDVGIEFSSRIGNQNRDSGTQTSSGSSSTDTGTGSGYRYTSTVYTGPGSVPDYRYRPPYSQLGLDSRNRNQGSEQTQYSPYTGSDVNQNFGDSRVQFVGGGSRVPIYNRNERVYGGSSNYIPNRGVLSNEPTCPVDSTRVLINNMDCTTAISTLGTFICYNYERVSRECCERCLPQKRAAHVGCEYGDWSYQCRNIQPFDCYNQRNRDICCQTCQYHKDRQSVVIPGCEYGDLTPRCQIIREKRHLCYLPENQRLCCVTCPSLADNDNGVCKWGDQNPDLCKPFDNNNQLRINCYMPTVKQICCETCERLKARTRDQIAGCEYGDRPVSFSTPYGVLDCADYIRRFGVNVCDNYDVSTHCCYTCHRYRSRPQSGKK